MGNVTYQNVRNEPMNMTATVMEHEISTEKVEII